MSAIASHKVNDVSEFFDTDYKSVSVLVGLDGLLNAHLISVYKQANQDQWKFKLRNADKIQWLYFKEYFSVKLLAQSYAFGTAKNNSDLDMMWKVLKEAMIQAATRNFGDLLNFDHLVKVWVFINEVEVFEVTGMIFKSVSSANLIKSKYYESKLAEDNDIRKTINCHIKNFCSDKEQIIKSILKYPFCKIVLDHLVIENKIVIGPKKIKLKNTHKFEDSLPGGLSATTLRKKFDKTAISTPEELAPTNKSTVAESESIGANHLGFTKSLFKHYSESAFNFYVNKRIAYLLGTPVNTESVRKTFYHKLIQNTSLPTNYNFKSIITEINKEIEHHTQQKYPITYANKGKRKLQTPAVTLQWIQSPTWKKHRIELPTNPSYYYTPGSAINITATDVFTLHATSTFGQFPFQSKQKKKDLLKPYGMYFKEFKSQSSMLSGLQFSLLQPDFRTANLEEEQEKEEEESEDQKFTYQNPIPENPNIETLNFLTQQNPNLKNPEIETPNFQIQHNQNNLIVINLALPINEQQQQLLQPSQQPQQLLQQQQQQLQQLNINPMAYTLIVKLEKFTSKEDDTQVWLNNVEKAIIANDWNDARAMQTIPYFLQDTADSWYQSLVNKLQDFAAFKLAFLQYFNNNNSINWLANTFTTIKQEENEAVTTYLECFHRNLHQIQAIQTDYFTVPQILNQFIKGLCSSILQRIYFEATKLEANHAQAINLVMNGLSELDSKLKQFSNLINQKLEFESCLSSSPNQLWQQETCVCHNCVPNSELSIQLSTILTDLLANNTTANISTTHILTSSLSTTIESYPKLEISNGCSPTDSQFIQPVIRIITADSQNYLSLLVTTEDISPNTQEPNQKQPLTNILPATIMEDKFLAAIFPFEIEELTETPLFSGATLEKKPIMAMYMDAKVDGHFIKLILNSESASSIITKQLMNQLGHRVDHAANTRIIITDGITKTPISKIDNFPIEVNSITILIKVLIMEAT
ncbi:hypothetical protein G9A89_010796 [Geosiphon pyriformis]|nr:hypothetical protein G9A89_010796 [Geosiphon pyriformis]